MWINTLGGYRGSVRSSLERCWIREVGRIVPCIAADLILGMGPWISRTLIRFPVAHHEDQVEQPWIATSSDPWIMMMGSTVMWDHHFRIPLHHC